MEEIRVSSEPSLFALIADRARHSSDGRLIANVAGGAILVVVVLILRPSLWLFVLPGIAFGAYGLWGVLERAGTEQRSAARRAGMWAAVLAGYGSAILFALVAMLLVFSGWIH